MTLPIPLPATLSIALYSSQQVYNMEQAWFDQGFSSFALMQQAAWQMTQRIMQLYNQHENDSSNVGSHLRAINSTRQKFMQKNSLPKACVWVGQGNNGGDGWLIAYYLQQAGWQVQIIVIGNKGKREAKSNELDGKASSDAIRAQQIALAADMCYQCFEDSAFNQDNLSNADIYIDALFGIGLDRAPSGRYQQAITSLNQWAKCARALVISVDIPSGLVASTGQVFDELAIQADVTLCLIARKFGLHTKDGMDYAGQVIDIPLIPHKIHAPIATLLQTAYTLPARRQNSHKGSYGHVLIIGGNRIDGSQGMGGAAILAAASAMATGAGKITVACHNAFHGALLTSLPDAMTVDLHNKTSVKRLTEEASVIAIGMGMGRDKTAQALVAGYIQAAISHKKPIVIDADGLYHLASLHRDKHEVAAQLKEYSQQYAVYLTPHSGEAARLLNKESMEIEADRLAAIRECADIYGGDWVLKGAGSLVLEEGRVYVCDVGNAGMATAGMGDVLAGLIAGSVAQQDLSDKGRSLRQAVLIHGLAGEKLVDYAAPEHLALLIGERGLQSQDMPAAIRHVMHLLVK